MSDYELLTEKARRLCEQGDRVASHHAYAEACRAQPDSAPAWCNLGAVAFLLTRYDEAANHYKHAQALQSDLEESWFGLARSYLATYRWTDALNALTPVRPLSDARRHGEWHYLTGMALERLGRIEEARCAYQVAVRHTYPPAQQVWPRFLLQYDSAENAVRACFDMTEYAKPRWAFVDLCLCREPQNLALYNLAAALFFDAQQYAYAARVAARAHLAVPDIDHSHWPALKVCAWS